MTHDDMVMLRKQLHQIPEKSGREIETAAFLEAWLGELDHHGMVTGLGGHGLAIFFEGERPGETLLFRGDMDGVPVTEKTGATHSSQHPGYSHACGHDGHMAILCGLAVTLSRQPPDSGRVVLLFQPAEETGAGADAVIKDPRFKALIPDRVFALHNLPGYPLGQVCLPDRLFACASLGLDISITGAPSHAARPEDGCSPLGLLHYLSGGHGLFSQIKGEPFFTGTVTHMQMGRPGFGVSPGRARVQVTLRSESDAYLDYRMSGLKQSITDAAGALGLACEFALKEEFPCTPVDRATVSLVADVARKAGLDVAFLPEPMQWSEDFGWFTQRYLGAMMGLGAGEGPQLHNADYDFPDALIEPGVLLFEAVIRELLSDSPEKKMG